MTTTPKALPALPDEPIAHMFPSDLERFEKMETTGTAYSVAVGCPEERSRPLFTASQMAAYAQQAIADHLTSAGGVEVVAWIRPSVYEECEPVITQDEEKAKAWIALHDNVDGLVRQSAHLAALSKEREVADGLARALKDALADLWLQVEPKHGPKAASEYPSIVAAQAALTAHRGSRSEAAAIAATGKKADA